MLLAWGLVKKFMLAGMPGTPEKLWLIISERNLASHKEATMMTILQNGPDFKEVASIALSQVNSVLNHFLPGGQHKGREYVTKNPTRVDRNPGSFSINMDTGQWADFATGDKGGDLVSLVTYVIGATNQSEGKEALETFLGISKESCISSVPRVPCVPVITKPINSSTSDADTVEHLAESGVFHGVPTDAPSPPDSHPELGIPCMRWAYHTPQGEIDFYVYRFDTTAGKEFRPLTFQNGKWTWKGPPAPRPLYNLHYLADHPHAVVIVTEGEKAADAAAIIFPSPEYVTSTWPHGAKSTNKADFSPLVGRNVWLWRDNDKAGIDAMRTVTKKLKEVGAATVHEIRLSFFNRHPDDPQTPLRKILPERWDAADAVAEGFSSKHLSDFLSDPSNLISLCEKTQQSSAATDASIKTTEPDGNSYQIVESRKGFRDGVYFFGVDKYGNPKEPLWVCSVMRVSAETRDTDQAGWGWLLLWKDPDGHDHRWACPKRLTQGDGIELCKELADRGLIIPPGIKAREHVIKYLCFSNPQQRLRCTETIGWHKNSFVLPNRTITNDSQGSESVIFQSESVATSTFATSGSLEQWRDNVSALCAGNSRLILAVSISFAGTLLHISGSENGGFHFVGESSSGKTTAQLPAASVWGAHDFKKTWNSTINGLEGTAAFHNDTLLTLDELSQSDPKTAGETAYLLANGQGKGRAGRSGKARRRQSWRLLFLSSGESDLAAHMLEAGKKTRAGQDIRLLNIPSDAGKGHGLFEELHGLQGGKEIADKIKECTLKYYGTAGPAFISKIIDNIGVVKDKISKLKYDFVSSHTKPGVSGQVYRAAERFGLVAVAGELATAFGITGWQPSEAEHAADVCFNAWIERRGGTGNQEATAILAQVRAHFESQGESRYVDLRRTESTEDYTRNYSRAGFREQVSTEDFIVWNYYVLPETFKTELCKGFEHKTVTKVLTACLPGLM